MLGKRLLLTLVVYITLSVKVQHIGFVLADDATIEVEPDTHDETVTGTITGSAKSLETYIRLFKHHRTTQLDAVKSIQQFGNSYEKKYKLVETIVHQLFKVMSDAKTNLTEWGFIPGDPFPENDTVREAISKILENTAMFGDLILRLPDITHAIYKRNKEWEFLIGWSVWTAIESRVFQGADEKMLNLMSQELGIIPKQEDYVNPYKEDEILKQMDNQKDTPTEKKKKTNKDKKKSKEKRKGPKLGGTVHTEL